MGRPRRKAINDDRFSVLLNALMKENGLSLSKLATKLEVHRSTVGHWCHGETLPDKPEIVSKIAKVLNAADRLSELMGASGFSLVVTQTSSIQDALEERKTSNISKQRISCVGRDVEIEKVIELLRKGRLLTIWGPGGIGKTCLATEASIQIQNEFDEVWIVTILEKSGDWSHPQLVQRIASTLKLRFDEGSSSQEQLLAFLHSKKILLVLDNFEEALDEKAILVELLDKTLFLKILVTSQVRLDLDKEQRYELKELPFPPEDCSIDELIDYPATALFIKKIQQNEPDFVLDDNNSSQVKRIIQLVHGFPLGLSLAAGMCSGRSYESVANELSHDLERLKSEYQDMNERHRSYLLIPESAWKRLDEQSRELVTWLVIFKGGFSEEAALQICGVDVDRDRAYSEDRFTDILFSLIRHSFIQFDRANNRYVMYEHLRKFVERKLDSDTRNHLRGKYAQYFLQRLEKNQQFVETGDIEKSEQIAHEFHDIYTGLSWLLDDPKHYVAATPYLDLFWELLDSQNRHQEIIALSTRLISLDMMSGQSKGRKTFKAKWLLRRGVSYYKSGMLPQGKGSLIAALGELGENTALLASGGQANNFDLARELLAQLQHRLAISFAASQDDNQNEFEMKARAYDTLSQIYFFDGNVGLTEYVVLRGANLAEKAASSEELIARFYANLCIGLVLESWSRPFARHYAGLALRLANKLKRSQKNKDSATAAYVFTVLSMYEIGLCNLPEGGRLARLAVEISEHLNRNRQYIEAAAMQINVLEFQGNYNDAQKLWSDVWRAASLYGDKQAIRWARAGIVEARLNLEIDCTSLVEIVNGLLRESVNENDKSILVNLRSLLAIIYLRNDMPANAEKLLKEVFEEVNDDNAINDQVLKLTDFSGYSGTAEVALRLQELSLQDQQVSDQEEINRMVTLACSQLAHFATVYPVADCRYLTWKGLSEYNMGKHKEARRAWQQSIVRAKERKMKFEEALARYEFGRHESEQSNARQQYLEEAFRIFQEVNSQYMMIMTKSELERLDL